MRVLLLAIAFISSFSSLAQESYEVSFEDVSLEEAIKSISSKYELKFSYDPQLLRQHRITKVIRTSKEKKLLEELLNDVPVHFKKAGNFILIIPDPTPKPEKITGKIYDEGTGQLLSFAQVATINQANINDGSGGFSIRTPRDSMQIIVTHLGYKPGKFWIKPDVANVNIKLTPDVRILPEFIFSDYSRNNSRGKFSSHFSVNPKQINSLPTLGEPDIFRSIQMLPGISASDDSNAGLVVRGSDPAQNQVILDGFTLYHLNHLFGLFSTFNPYVINQVDLYKSGFTARYGGRISAVVNATGKKGNTDEFKGGAGISLTSLNTYFETPINRKISVIFGLRRSYQNFIKNNIYDRFLRESRVDLNQTQLFQSGLDAEPDFNFFDMNAKMTADLGKGSSLDINFYLSDDDFDSRLQLEEEFFSTDITDVANWSNLGLSLYWNKDWNGDVITEIGTSFSNFESSSSYEEENQFLDVFFADSLFDVIILDTIQRTFRLDQLNNIEEFSIHWKNQILLNDDHSLYMGTDISSFFTEYYFAAQFDREFSENFSDTIQESTQVSSYLEYEAEFNRLHMNLGLRYNYFELSDRTDWEPRFNARYYLTDQLSLNASWSIHHQYVTRISFFPFANSDAHEWVMADDLNFPTMRSVHFVAGAKYNIDNWSFDLEYFSKENSGIFQSELFYFYQTQPLGELFLSLTDFSSTGYARGIDFFAKYKSDQFTSWLSYSFADGKSENPFVNEGRPFNASFNQRHEINQVNMLKLGNWHFSSQFVFGSGRPYTIPVFTELNEFNDIKYDLNQINSARLPSYHRLDLSVKYSKSLPGINLETGFSLFNVYNRRNIRARRFTLLETYDEAQDRNRTFIVPIEFKLLGITPNLTINISF